MFEKKNTTRIAARSYKKKDLEAVRVANKKNRTILLVAAIIPILLLAFFTFKGVFSRSPKANNDEKILVIKTPVEVANSATEALRKGDTPTFFTILENEVQDNLNVVNSRGDTLLMSAVDLGNLEAVQRLLALGVDVNRVNAFTRDTALIRALLAENDDITRLLVYADANVNVKNNYGQSPMSLAIEKRKGNFVDLFLTSGVKTGVDKETLFRSVAQKNYTGVLAMLKGGVDPNIRDSQNNTPLIISASRGDAPSVRELLAYRADVNAANRGRNTALMYAAGNNHEAVVDILLMPHTMQYATDLDMQNSKGQTALFLAAGNGYASVVQKLLNAGASFTLKDKTGLMPLQIAQKNRRAGTIRVIENFIKQKEAEEAAKKEKKKN